MRTAFWESIVDSGCQVPPGTKLDELAGELVGMLGHPDPHVRDELGYSVLATWISEGVYDDLLPGLGDGLVAGLRLGLGEDGTDTVLRRSYSALALAEVVRRDNALHLLHPQQVLTWADRSVGWFLAERDLRGRDPRLGVLHAVGHGADLLGALAASRHLGADELGVLLDVVADRLLRPTRHRWLHGEEDRLALAVMSVLHRDLVGTERCEAWVERLAGPFAEFQPPGTEPVRDNLVAFLRALHLQLLLGVDRTPTQADSTEPGRPPSVRADLLIALQRALRRSAPHILRQA